jgi:hypothetical protein
LNAQFFYASLIHLDDPLSAATAAGGSDSKAQKIPLRPFSAGDNNALERAWLALGSDSCRRTHARARRDRSPSPSLSGENAEKLGAIIDKIAAKHKLKHEREGQGTSLVTDTPTSLPDSAAPVCCSELVIDASAELRNEFCALARTRQRYLDQDSVIEGVMAQLEGRQSGTAQADVAASSTEQTAHAITSGTGTPQPSTANEARNSRSRVASMAASGAESLPETLPVADAVKALSIRPPVHEDGISGTPFARVGAETPPQASPIGSVPKSAPAVNDRAPPKERGRAESQSRQVNDFNSSSHAGTKVGTVVEESTDIPVGVSRLHKVALPVLQMKPIYWSPVNDISTVMRSTWFYK